MNDAAVTTVLTPSPAAARLIPARTTFVCAPEASMATVRLAARVAVVASQAHGSLGADIEKNTVIKSSTRTTPNRSRTRDRSRSSALPDFDRPLSTGRAYPLYGQPARTRRRIERFSTSASQLSRWLTCLDAFGAGRWHHGEASGLSIGWIEGNGA